MKHEIITESWPSEEVRNQRKTRQLWLGRALVVIACVLLAYVIGSTAEALWTPITYLALENIH